MTSRRVYSGKIINLDVESVVFPDGTAGELEMIRHPGAAAIVPIVTEDHGEIELLLLRQYRHAAGGYIYEIPAGRLDPGERPVDCARRELMEETGCTAGEIRPLFTMYTTPGFTDERIHVFAASGLVFGEAAREADEFMSIERVTLAGALRLIKDGLLTDGKSAFGILYVAQFGTGA